MFKGKIRTSYVKPNGDTKKIKCSYEFDPQLSRDVIAGRLLMVMFLYTHVNRMSTVFTNVEQMCKFLGMEYSERHWHGSSGIRILDAGMEWLSDNRFASFADGHRSFDDYKYKQTFYINVNTELFNMDIGSEGAFDPYFTFSESDVKRITSVGGKLVPQLFHIYCYVKACMSWSAPYHALVTMEHASKDTGYDDSTIGRMLKILCDDLGVLHRDKVKYASASRSAAYVYVADNDGWETRLKHGVEKVNAFMSGSSPVEQAQIDAKYKNINHKQPEKAEEPAPNMVVNFSPTISGLPGDIPQACAKSIAGLYSYLSADSAYSKLDEREKIRLHASMPNYNLPFHEYGLQEKFGRFSSLQGPDREKAKNIVDELKAREMLQEAK